MFCLSPQVSKKWGSKIFFACSTHKIVSPPSKPWHHSCEEIKRFLGYGEVWGFGAFWSKLLLKSTKMIAYQSSIIS